MNYDIEQVNSAWKGHRKFAEWLVNYIQPTTSVDLGVDFGYSLFCLANPRIGTVYGIDSFEGDAHAGHRNTYDSVVNVINENNYTNIKLVKGYFDDVAKTWTTPIDILHIDGLHTTEAVANDYNTWSKFLSDSGVIIMHDTAAFKSVKNFYDSINLPKLNFTHSAGLGVVSRDATIIETIKKLFLK